MKVSLVMQHPTHEPEISSSVSWPRITIHNQAIAPVFDNMIEDFRQRKTIILAGSIWSKMHAVTPTYSQNIASLWLGQAKACTYNTFRMSSAPLEEKAPPSSRFKAATLPSSTNIEYLQWKGFWPKKCEKGCSGLSYRFDTF